MFTWLIHREYRTLTKENRELVELGFARFTEEAEETEEVEEAKGEKKGKELDRMEGVTALVDEPLVILAATHMFMGEKGFSLEDYIRTAINHNQGIGLEQCIAYYLTCAFDGQRKLCDIFDFGSDDVPEWAKQPAELVAVDWDEGDAKVTHFDLSDFLGSPTLIGTKCNTIEETLNWFRNRTSAMCFPDNNMGPDIVAFVRLLTGQKLALAIQCKCMLKATLSSSERDSTILSVHPSNFYDGKVCYLILLNAVLLTASEYRT